MSKFNNAITMKTWRVPMSPDIWNLDAGFFNISPASGGGNWNTPKTVNHEGHAAYELPDKLKLVTQVLTSFFDEKKYYGDNTEDMKQAIQRVIQKVPQFVSNLAVFARREFHMRSVAHVLTAYLAHEENGKPYVRRTVEGVALRGDDVTEIMAFYLSTFGKPVPNALKKGIGHVMSGFDEYTLAKYQGIGKSVKMRDLLCLCHPAPANKDQEALWKRCLEGKLAVPFTWETQLSENGNNKETWEALIDSGKVGYMALLRNLRSIVLAKPDNITKVLDRIADPEAVRHSKQLPFRFLSAYKNLPFPAPSKIYDALEAAADASVENLPKLHGTTVIAVDVSGSMGDRISGKSEVKCCEIGMLLGLIANRICDESIFFLFNHEIEQKTISSRTGLLYAATHEAKAYGLTNMDLPLYEMVRNHINASRIIILSDFECNSGHQAIQHYADMYRRRVNSDFWVHAIDLQGYGTQQFIGPKTNIIAGWSEKVFEFIGIAEKGEGSLEKEISEYTW